MRQPGTGTLSGLPLLPIPLSSRDHLSLGQAPQSWDSPVLSPTASRACAPGHHPMPSPTARSACALPLCRATANTGSGSLWVCARCLCPQESPWRGSGRTAGVIWQQDSSPQGSMCPGNAGELMEGCGAREGKPAPGTAANPRRCGERDLTTKDCCICEDCLRCRVPCHIRADPRAAGEQSMPGARAAARVWENPGSSHRFLTCLAPPCPS